MNVRWILRIENALLFCLIVMMYRYFDFSFWLFFLLLFVPDVSMIGYLKSKKIGAAIYNAGHTLIYPIILCTLSYFMNWELYLGLGLIWCAHIFMDRTLGYGLKYPSNFKVTHIQKV